MSKVINIGNLSLGNNLPLVLFGGMNVLESKELAVEIATELKMQSDKLGIPYVFKASFDKANRSSLNSYRGPGMKKGIEILAEIKEKLGVPVITDLHEPEQAHAVAEVADVIQLPAFLSRQTDLVAAMAKTKAIINIKKAQFLAPHEMGHILKKFESAGNDQLILCERGTSFGYNNLVVDMLGFRIMKGFGYPVMFDVTHSLQLPGGRDNSAGGRREAALDLALAGVSQSISSIFLEVHPDPDKALCDGPCALPLSEVASFLEKIKAMDVHVKAGL